jgi:hypothetical protein
MRDSGENKEPDAPGGRQGWRGTQAGMGDDTRLQPSNKNSPEQYMTAIIGTYGRTLIFLGLSIPWHSKPAAHSTPSSLPPSLSLR